MVSHLTVLCALDRETRKGILFMWCGAPGAREKHRCTHARAEDCQLARIEPGRARLFFVWRYFLFRKVIFLYVFSKILPFYIDVTKRTSHHFF